MVTMRWRFTKSVCRSLRVWGGVRGVCHEVWVRRYEGEARDEYTRHYYCGEQRRYIYLEPNCFREDVYLIHVCLWLNWCISTSRSNQTELLVVSRITTSFQSSTTTYRNEYKNNGFCVVSVCVRAPHLSEAFAVSRSELIFHFEKLRLHVYWYGCGRNWSMRYSEEMSSLLFAVFIIFAKYL